MMTRHKGGPESLLRLVVSEETNVSTASTEALVDYL